MTGRRKQMLLGTLALGAAIFLAADIAAIAEEHAGRP